jgi:L-fucose isomerase-like protein
MDNVTGKGQPKPRLGLVLHSIDAFNPAAKDSNEAALRRYFKELLDTGAIAPDSLILGRLNHPWDATEAANKMAAAQVDLIVIGDVAFPNGHVFLTIATHPNLARTPLAIVADPEPHPTEWATNAWCGAIMGNWTAKQLGRPIVTFPGPTNSQAFRTEFARLLRVAAAIKGLRNDYLCRFGDAPSGFHSATGDQLAFAATFGTRVDTVDLTAVMDVYRKGKAAGYLGAASFTDADTEATIAQISTGRKVLVEKDMLQRAAKLYHAYRAIIRANGYTSASFRCWPESNEEYINTSSCLIISLLLGNGDLTAAACEGDWPTAVVQTMGTLLAGKPAACLDWVNYTGGSEIIQLGHCGVGICGQMAPNPPGDSGPLNDVVTVHPVLRQCGKKVGPVHVGQFAYGPKTGLCLMRGTDNKFRILCFRGESSPETAKGMTYAAADVRVADPQRLNRLVLEYGFPHHLAVAMSDVSTEVRMLCTYLGVEYISPDN